MSRTLRQGPGQAQWRQRLCWVWLISLSGCRGEQSMLDTHSATAQNIERLWWWTFYGATAVLVLVMTLALYAIYRRPERRGAISATKFVGGGGVLLRVAALTPLAAFGMGVGSRAGARAPGALGVGVTGRGVW